MSVKLWSLGRESPVYALFAISPKIRAMKLWRLNNRPRLVEYGATRKDVKSTPMHHQLHPITVAPIAIWSKRLGYATKGDAVRLTEVKETLFHGCSEWFEDFFVVSYLWDLKPKKCMQKCIGNFFVHQNYRRWSAHRCYIFLSLSCSKKCPRTTFSSISAISTFPKFSLHFFWSGDFIAGSAFKGCCEISLINTCGCFDIKTPEDGKASHLFQTLVFWESKLV